VAGKKRVEEIEFSHGRTGSRCYIQPYCETCKTDVGEEIFDAGWKETAAELKQIETEHNEDELFKLLRRP
jgi:hypothetical protein